MEVKAGVGALPPGAPVAQGGPALTLLEGLHVALLKVEAEIGEVVLQDAPCRGEGEGR